MVSKKNNTSELQDIERYFKKMWEGLKISEEILCINNNSYKSSLRESYSLYNKGEYKQSLKKLYIYNSQCFFMNAESFLHASNIYWSIWNSKISNAYQILENIDPFHGDRFYINEKIKSIEISFVQEANIFLWVQLYWVLLYNNFPYKLKKIKDIRAVTIILLYDFINNKRTLPKGCYRKFYKYKDNIFYPLFCFLYTHVFYKDIEQAEKINMARNVLTRENMVFNLFEKHATSHEFAYYILSQEWTKPINNVYYFLHYIDKKYKNSPVQVEYKTDQKILVSLLQGVNIHDNQSLEESVFHPIISIFFAKDIFYPIKESWKLANIKYSCIMLDKKYIYLLFNIIILIFIIIFIVNIFLRSIN